jgi:Secretion system C-terminal sorting domain
MFISKLDASGNYVTAMNAGGTGIDIGYAITVISGCYLYAGGTFAATADFDGSGSSGSVTALGTAGGAVPYQITDAYLAKYGCDLVVLPIELLNFTATTQNNKNVLLNWTTLTETNNEWFNIEHSTDGINFSLIDVLPGAGNSYSEKNYTLNHATPVSGHNYYRIKQIDYDGKFSYSNIESAYIGALSIVNVYPNPAADIIQVVVGSEDEASIEVQVINVIGQRIKSVQQNLLGGYTTVEINVSDIAQGVYAVKVITPTGEHTEKEFLKQ